MEGNMKKVYKITLILLLIFILFSLNNVKAKDIWETSKEFLQTGSEGIGTLEESGKILNLLGVDTKGKFVELIDFLWGLGLLTIFISTVVLGIKYMFVLPQEKSRLKQATTPYVIGVVIIFGALTIWKFVIVVLDGSL